MLAAEQPLPERFRDHARVGEWRDHRDCHVRPDLVLIYRKPDDDSLELVRLASHSVEVSGDRQPIDLLKGADGAAEVVSVQAVDCAGREMSPIEQRFGFGDQRRILVVRAVWRGVVDRSAGDRGYGAGRTLWAAGGGGGGADEQGGGERGGEQAKHGFRQPISTRPVPASCSVEWN